MNIPNGDVFVFVNATRNRMKILHREEGGIVLYALRIEMDRMRLSFSDETRTKCLIRQETFRLNERKEATVFLVQTRTDAFRHALAGGRIGGSGCRNQEDGGAECKDHRGEVSQA